MLRSGYGDCKDKSLLLVAMLRQMGIRAYPALTSSERGPGLPERPPSPTAFDHVIVQVVWNGKSYWVDPTASHQGGRFPQTTPLTYAWALPIKPGQDKLEPIPLQVDAETTVDIVERYTLAPNGGPLKLTVRTSYRADEADATRAHLASASRQAIEKRSLAYYGQSYPGIRAVAAIEVKDDRDANILTLVESYELAREAFEKNGLDATFMLNAESILVFEAPAGVRHAALQVAYPINRRHRIIVDTPGRRPPAPADASIDGVAFKMTLEVDRQGDVLMMDYRLVGKTQVVEPGQMDAYREEVDELQTLTQPDLDLTSNSGGTIGRGDPLSWLIGIVVCGLVVVGAVQLIRQALAADAAYAAKGFYYPVSVSKFVLLNLATVGSYSFFWFWKCWRWAKQHDRDDGRPFLRAVFALFWIYPLFERVNRKAGPLAMPVWIGRVAMAGYFAFRIADFVFLRSPATPILLQLAPVAAFVCFLPTLKLVNALNADDNHALVANSRFTGMTVAAIGCGALSWALVLYGITA